MLVLAPTYISSDVDLSKILIQKDFKLLNFLIFCGNPLQGGQYHQKVHAQKSKYIHQTFIQQQPKVQEENSEYVASHRQLKDLRCVKMSKLYGRDNMLQFIAEQTCVLNEKMRQYVCWKVV